MGRGEEDRMAARQHLARIGQVSGVGGQRRGSGLERSGNGHSLGTKRPQMLGRDVILRGNQAESREEVGIKPVQRLRRSKASAFIRALTSASGMPRAAVAVTAPGQRSCSAQTESEGRQ